MTPKTVSRFLEFVSGKEYSATGIPLCYKDSKVDRVLAGGWMQVGGIDCSSNLRNTLFKWKDCKRRCVSR